MGALFDRLTLCPHDDWRLRLLWFLPRAFVAMALGLTIAVLASCAVVEPLTQALPRSSVEENAAIKEARRAVDESNAALAALNQVIGDNVAAGIWTKSQAQALLDDSKAAGKKLDAAREMLRAGQALEAKTQAELIKQAVLALHRRVAAEARKEGK